MMYQTYLYNKIYTFFKKASIITNPIRYRIPNMMNSVFVVKKLASNIENMPAQPQPVNVIA